jgi:hypothetical protein
MRMPISVRVGLVVLSTLLSAASTVPYIIATAKHQTQPRVVTWLTWALLTAVGGAASASAGDYPSAAFSLIGTVATTAVVIAGLRYGDRTFGRIDVTCLILVLVGFGLWLILNVPGIAVAAACVIDFIGLVPTLAHAWRRPYEETAVTYALIAAGGAAATAAAWGTWTITAVAYPIYVLLSMGVCSVVVVLRRARFQASDESGQEGSAADARAAKPGGGDALAPDTVVDDVVVLDVGVDDAAG